MGQDRRPSGGGDSDVSAKLRLKPEVRASSAPVTPHEGQESLCFQLSHEKVARRALTNNNSTSCASAVFSRWPLALTREYMVLDLRGQKEVGENEQV